MRTMTHAEFLALRRFDALDGLRALAAVMVVFFHYARPWADGLSGWIGVHIFFVVSGFLITTLMLRERDRTGRISLRAFYLRRIFRIWPLYYLALFVSAVAAYQSGAWDALTKHLPHFLLFMNEYHLQGNEPFLHSWTIGIEWKFYMVWPIVLIGVSAISTKLRIPLGIAAIALVLVPYSDAWPGIHYSVLLIGALLALVLHSPRGYALMRPLTHPVAGVAAAIAFVFLHMHIPGLTVRLGDQEHAIFVYALALALVMPSLLAPGPGRWLLSLRPLVYIGERSYGLYLFQAIAAGLAAVLTPWASAGNLRHGTAVVLVSLLVADYLYKRLEQPMINLGRTVIKRYVPKRPAPVPAPASEPSTSSGAVPEPVGR
ncbi:acyltransferase family protein [Streptomyces sp. NRRL WC-3742]|uniref:acyltransferase family protein n=1 Tax=Streptomyces sp. NRRL WC-3742 TaxID=1463934 RepID=UPI0004CABD6E|nr:acyltransferase [Streptomyces sp. NRRL WC-3742]